VIVRARLLLLTAALGCSNLTDTGGGVVALELRAPAVTSIEVGDTVRLSARALDKQGDSVATEISWRSVDTTLVVDGAGLVTGHAPGIGRVQAVVGSLSSDPVALTVTARADSVVLIGPDTSSVQPGDPASVPLAAQLTTTTPPGPLQGGTLVYTIIEPVFASAADRTVEFPSGALADTVTTGADGQPVIPVSISRVPGVTSPDSAIVAVSASRAHGVPVPGSGQQFIVRFLSAP
jgi:hypothetical protein